MTENDLPEDLARPQHRSFLRDPMFWVATVLILIAAGMVAAGISNGALR